MRDQIKRALHMAAIDGDATQAALMRLLQTAIADRDHANRQAGKEPLSDQEIRQMLSALVGQRRRSAQQFEHEGKLDLAEQERQEIHALEKLLPEQLDDNQTRLACAQVIEETGADGLRDLGPCVATLKSKFPGQMDFSKASTIVRAMLK